MGSLFTSLIISFFLLLLGSLAVAYYLEMLEKRSVEMSSNSTLTHIILLTLFFPEFAFQQLMGKNAKDESQSDSMKLCLFGIFSLVMNLEIVYLTMVFLWKPVDWAVFIGASVGTVLSFALIRRILAVRTILPLYKVYKEKTLYVSEIADFDTQILSLEKKVKKGREIVLELGERHEKAWQQKEEVRNRIQNLEQRVLQHQQAQKDKQEIVESNLKILKKLEEEGVEIALDTNVLMKCDAYLAEQLAKNRLLISKTVQFEWDHNKSDSNRSKAFKAREAIRRMLTLSNEKYDFVVRKWNDAFMKEHNLLQGKADEEIIADYLYEYKKGRKIVLLTDDNNFMLSARKHLPILELHQIDLFSKRA